MEYATDEEISNVSELENAVSKSDDHEVVRNLQKKRPSRKK